MATFAATTTDSGHIRKRQFQPSIDSYFHTRLGRCNNEMSSSAPERALSPALLPDTQASLLSVGMRVRKNVPEGYKTHKTLEGSWEESPSQRSAPVAQVQRRSHGFRGVAGRELAPFCGLHKTGGWGAQSVPASSAPAVMEDDDEDLPDLMVSQSSEGSFWSTISGYGENSRKRTHEEEVEEEMDAYFGDMDDADRTFEVPERPKAKLKGSAKTARAGGVRVFGEDDFEDADFLAPMDIMEVD